MNTRYSINDLAAFLALAKERSFTRAAAQLGVSQSRLSQTIRSLEENVGIRLFNRTTRSVAPTEAGEYLFQKVGPHFQEIEAELIAVSALGGRPAGTVRISATEHAAERVLWPGLRKLLVRYSDIRVEIAIDYGLVDIVAQGADAGVRLGGMVAQDMIAVPIGPQMRMAVVGTPDYFERFTVPTTPQDLAQHNCINLRFATHGGLYAWEFDRNGEETRVRVQGQVVVNTTTALLTATLAGLGLAYLPEDFVNMHIADGRLVQVLSAWCAPFDGYHLYYPSRRQQSAAFSLLIEALRFRG